MNIQLVVSVSLSLDLLLLLGMLFGGQSGPGNWTSWLGNCRLKCGRCGQPVQRGYVLVLLMVLQ